MAVCNNLGATHNITLTLSTTNFLLSSRSISISKGRWGVAVIDLRVLDKHLDVVVIGEEQQQQQQQIRLDKIKKINEAGESYDGIL